MYTFSVFHLAAVFYNVQLFDEILFEMQIDTLECFFDLIHK